MDTKYDVLVMYNGEDRARAEEIAQTFADSGLTVWFDIWNLMPGFNVVEQLHKAIDSSRYVVYLLGQRGYREDPWAQGELRPAIRFARDPKVRIVPVLLPGATDDVIPTTLSLYNYYDLRDWNPDSLQRLALILRRSDRAAAGEDPSPRVFLCHASEDAEHAEALHRELKLHGFDPWLDKAYLTIGDNWESEIENAIEKTDFFAILLSKAASRKTGFINREIQLAIRQLQRRPHGMAYLLPIRLEDFEVPRIRLTETATLHELQWIDVLNTDAESIKPLAKGIWKQWAKRRDEFGE